MGFALGQDGSTRKWAIQSEARAFWLESVRSRKYHCTTREQENGMTGYDAIIIGTGQAGPSLARRLAGSGMKVAIIERDRFGGTCVNTGCTPTKTLVASAYAAHMARRGADYGFDIGGEVKVDLKRVKAPKGHLAGPLDPRGEGSRRSVGH